MDLILGGAYQGKTAYAAQQYHIGQKDWFDCSEITDPEQMDFSKQFYRHVERYVYACVCKEKTPEIRFREDAVLLFEDIFCGIVPLAPKERAYRETAGLYLSRLASGARRVSRLFCGIPQELKVTGDAPCLFESDESGVSGCASDITVIGIGPGDKAGMTIAAKEALQHADVIIGYRAYLDLLPDDLMKPGAEKLATGMREERERSQMAFEQALQKKCVAVICSGDAGIYGMASLILETGAAYPDITVSVIPGVTAALSGAALLGAPLGHDTCIISLSDLLTPWEIIEKRLKAAATGDFCIVLYNPGSQHRPFHLKKACAILEPFIEADRPCGIAENIAREGETTRICTFSELSEMKADMHQTVYIGNSETKVLNGRLVTPRGYMRSS